MDIPIRCGKEQDSRRKEKIPGPGSVEHGGSGIL